MPVTWNSYLDHPVGYHLDDISVDFWGDGGRGDPITPVHGNLISQRALKNSRLPAIAWMIWNRRIWRPNVGWMPYNGWSGWHEDHVHITWNLYSRTAGKWPNS